MVFSFANKTYQPCFKSKQSAPMKIGPGMAIHEHSDFETRGDLWPFQMRFVLK